MRCTFLLFFVLSPLYFSAQTLNVFHLTDTTFQIGAVYKLDCFYNIHSWNIENDWYGTSCDSLVTFLKAHSKLKVEIGCHSDSRPIPMTNDTLTLRKAEGLMSYLIDKGVPKQRLTARGYGSNAPIISDEEIQKKKTTSQKEMAHQVNRRIEIKILSVEK